MSSREYEYNQLQKLYRKKYLQQEQELEKNLQPILDTIKDRVLNQIVMNYSRNDGRFDSRYEEQIKEEVRAISFWYEQELVSWLDAGIQSSAELAIKAEDNAARRYIGSLLDDYSGEPPVRNLLRQAVGDPEPPFLIVARYGDGLPRAIRDTVWKKRWADGYKLSDRIWNQQALMNNNLQGMIEQCVNEGRSAVEFARAVEDYLEVPGPKWTTAIRPAKTEAGSIKYNALRLARTETNQAYHRAHHISAENSILVKGVKWNLSASHPPPEEWPPSAAFMGYPEICDYYAEDDHHGLGPGVFPAKAGSIPFDHPNGLCYKTDVLLDDKELIEALKEKYDVEDFRIDYDPEYRELVPGEYSAEAVKGLERAHGEVLQHGKSTGNELLATINKEDGSRAFRSIEGDRSSVHFPSELTRFLRQADNNSIIMTHNHPSSGSFSDADLRVLNHFSSVDAMTVQAHDGRKYFVRIGQGRTVDAQQLKDMYDGYIDEYLDVFRSKIERGELSSSEAWKEHTHIAVRELSRELGWEYNRVIPYQD